MLQWSRVCCVWQVFKQNVHCWRPILFFAARVEESCNGVLWVGVYCSQLLERQKAISQYVNMYELTIKYSTKASIVRDVLQHQEVVESTVWTIIDCCCVFYVSLSVRSGGSVVIVLASFVAGGVASAC